MRLIHAATITTALIVVAGIAMVSPLFFREAGSEPQQKVMLSFSISDTDGALEWSRSLADMLNNQNTGAAVFIEGQVAEQYPQIVSWFGNKVDVGSRSYRNLDLTDIEDYTLKLQEVKKGKEAVDNAGNIDSGIFRAPFGSTDQDIYSLLSRSGIIADFSYDNHFNLYQNNQFIKYDAFVFEGLNYSPEYFSTLQDISRPMIINFDSTCPIPDIEAYVVAIRNSDLKFVNASELAGFTLTDRGR